MSAGRTFGGRSCRRALAWLAVVVYLGGAVPGLARMWRVERDGSGDYTVIQDAVDAAATGDTIRIGAGRYTEYREYSIGGSEGKFLANVYVFINVDNLTLVGEGAEQTIIGPESFHYDNPDSPKGLAVLGNVNNVKVQGLGIEWVRHGIYRWLGSMQISNCGMRNCDAGVLCMTDAGSVVEDCTFDNNNNNGFVSFHPARNIDITKCVFNNITSSLSFNGTQDANVYFCSFTGGLVAVELNDGSTGGVYDCTFLGIEYTSIGVGLGSSACLERNLVSGGGESLIVWNGSHVYGLDNVFSGNWYSTITICSSTFDFHHNNILYGGGWSVHVDCPHSPPPRVYDLTDNYWGTTDRNQISEWIWDGNDPQDPILYGTVDFEPFLDSSIGTEQKSWGGVKELYRSPGPNR
jgi:hypothetical protein